MSPAVYNLGGLNVTEPGNVTYQVVNARSQAASSTLTLSVRALARTVTFAPVVARPNWNGVDLRASTNRSASGNLITDPLQDQDPYGGRLYVSNAADDQSGVDLGGGGITVRLT